ncbi:MAG TPA: acyl-CoA dehydrogenase family protein, partial [Terracidiphilus sp.]
MGYVLAQADISLHCPVTLTGTVAYVLGSHAPEALRQRFLDDVVRMGGHTKTGLPTGEIDLLGAEAAEIAPPPEGFKLMMEALEYSRVHNEVGSAGMQRRALREALTWAKTRRAFSRVIADYPMVQDELLRMRVQFEAGTLLAFEAAVAFDETQLSAERRTWLRLATALAKYLTAEYAIMATRATLELIGGNATPATTRQRGCCATRRYSPCGRGRRTSRRWSCCVCWRRIITDGSNTTAACRDFSSGFLPAWAICPKRCSRACEATARQWRLRCVMRKVGNAMPGSYCIE